MLPNVDAMDLKNFMQRHWRGSQQQIIVYTLEYTFLD